MTAPIRQQVTLRQDERGIALAIAIFALVIIATLVAGAFFMARLEQRSGTNALWSTQAQEAADAGLNATLADWSGTYNTMDPGESSDLATVTMGSGIRYTPSVTKISDRIFLVESTGERVDAGGGVLSGTKVGRIVRIIVPDVDIDAALTANGPVTQGGTSVINGNDNLPLNWDPAECAPGPPVAGLRTSDSLTTNGNALTLDGAPPLVEDDASVTSDMITSLFDELKELVKPGMIMNGNWGPNEPVLPVVDGAGNCTTSINNWGEPWRLPQLGTVVACVSRAPVIHIKGDFKVTSGGGGRRGQGILLVDGDFDIAGNFEFAGIVIALGAVKMTGTGNKITGAVLTNSMNGAAIEESAISGNPNVLYSACAIAAVVAGNANARPLAERSWVQLY
jgi:hypothetical protein